MFTQFLINGFITGILYSLAAVGFALVYNTTKIFHIAAAGIYVAAAYIFYYTYFVLGIPIVPAGIASLALSGLLSVLCEWVVYRPQFKKKASLNVILISSIGLMIVLVNIIAMYFGNETKIVENSIQPTTTLGNLIITRPQLLQLFIGGAALAGLLIFLKKSSYGLKIKALSNQPVLYETLGFNTVAIRTFIFVLSGIFLALGSTLTAYDLGMDPHTGMPILINAMVAMIIGGNGKVGAAILGGLLLGILQSVVVYYFSANWQNAITFAILLLFLFFRPQGILGYKKRTV